MRQSEFEAAYFAFDERRQMKLKDFPLMTVVMLNVLRTMRDEKQNDNPWLYLDDVHKKTLTTLRRNKWIFKSEANALDRARYSITSQGLKALEAYDQPARTVGRPKVKLCPRCKARNKHVWPGGKVAKLCKPCHVETCVDYQRSRRD